jgi:MFS family permease
MIAGGCTFLNVYCTQPVLPLLMRVFHASEVAVSMTVGAVTLSVALTAPFIGMMAESVGRKRVIVPALFAMAAATLFTATASSLHALVCWRFVQGIFVPGVIAVIIAYINFYLARPPFNLGPAALGGIFLVYLLGCVVTPLAGRFLDRHGFRRTALCSVGMSLSGLLLTLVPGLPAVIAGLALFSSGIFVSQAAATVLTGRVAKRSRSAAAGLYVTCYYTGGSVAAVATAWFWMKGGWPACVGLFVAASLATLGFGMLGGKALAAAKRAGAPGGTAI